MPRLKTASWQEIPAFKVAHSLRNSAAKKQELPLPTLENVSKSRVKKAPVRIRGWRAVHLPVASRPYDRNTDLVRLLPIATGHLDANGPQSPARLIALLRRALRQERARGLSGHWTYDLGRHSALLKAYRAECAAQQDRR